MCNRLGMSGCVVGSCRYGNVVFVSDSGLRAAPRSELGAVAGNVSVTNAKCIHSTASTQISCRLS